jgi:hypothetical protein
MGYRKIPTIYTLDMAAKNPEYEGLVIRMKAISFGKVRRLILATESADDENFEEMLDLIMLGLVSWNLVDENDQEIPANQDGLDDQDFPFVMDIVEAWLECMTGVDEDLGKGSPSGPQFPGRPVTMAAL